MTLGPEAADKIRASRLESWGADIDEGVVTLSAMMVGLPSLESLPESGALNTSDVMPSL